MFLLDLGGCFQNTGSIISVVNATEMAHVHTKYWKSHLYICTEEHTAELDLLAQNPMINPKFV